VKSALLRLSPSNEVMHQWYRLSFTIMFHSDDYVPLFVSGFGLPACFGICTTKTQIPDNPENWVTNLKLGYIFANGFNFPGQFIHRYRSPWSSKTKQYLPEEPEPGSPCETSHPYVPSCDGRRVFLSELHCPLALVFQPP